MRLSYLSAPAGLMVGVASQSGPTVTTLNGTLQGARCPSTEVNAFLSIPFGKAPVGDLRFAAPQPWVASFNGTRNATKAAPSCVQFSSQWADDTNQTEDW